MPAQRVCVLQNMYVNGISGHLNREEGICTAASLVWAKHCLLHPRFRPRRKEDLPYDEHILNGLMARWRAYDFSPTEQTTAFGLEIVGGADHVVGTMTAMLNIAVATAPYVCIFWNSYHTMGFRQLVETFSRGGVGQTRHEFEVYDQNSGLYFSRLRTDFDNWYVQQYPDPSYPILGMRVVQLPH